MRLIMAKVLCEARPKHDVSLVLFMKLNKRWTVFHVNGRFEYVLLRLFIITEESWYDYGNSDNIFSII